MTSPVRTVRLWQRRLKMDWWRARARRAAARRTRHVPDRVRTAPIGVNVIGPLSAPSGMGEAARASIRTLQAADIPVATLDFEAPEYRDAAPARRAAEALPHPFTLVHFNADRMRAVRAHLGPGAFADRYTIGYWFWELPQFRADWLGAFGDVDEVWTASAFTRGSIAAESPVPVLRLPFGLWAPHPGPYGRAHFGLPEGPFLFLAPFDASSQVTRKNPEGALEAFRLAGFAHGEAALVLKISRADANPSAVRALREAAAGLHVYVLEGEWPRDEQDALLACTDACLSLHRAEGFGLNIAEHMLLGRPAIATAYSGNMDFMTPEVSGLVPAHEVAIVGDHGPYLEGWTWAEPDVRDAAGQLQSLVRTPGYAQALGGRGRRHVAALFDPVAAGTAMRARLGQIQEER